MTWRPFRDWGLKLAALGLGTLLWITVSGQQVERSVVVQLQFRNVPASLEIIGDAPHTVDVRLRGASGQISRLAATDVVATVDLTGTRPGPRVFPLTADHISVPLGIEVKSVDPAAISLTLEKSTIAEVPVKPTVDGDPAPGFEVAEIISDPKRTRIIGPESHVKELPPVVTERISVEGARSSVTETVSMGPSDSTLRLVDARAARVTVRVAAAPVTRFSGRPLSFRNLAPGRTAVADPSTITIPVRARRDVLTTLRDEQLKPYVDLAGLAPGRYTLPVHVDADGEYVIDPIEPASIVVRIR
jgi:YbbR domain-containing protein